MIINAFFDAFHSAHILILLLGLIGSALFYNAKSNQTETFTSLVKPDDFLLNLQHLDYFSFTDEKKLATLNSALKLSLIENRGLSTVLLDNSEIPTDYRFYKINSEKILEKGELVSILNLLKKSFNKFDLPFSVTNDSSIVLNGELEQRITLNGQEYLIYQGENASPKKEGIAMKNFVEMINDQLKKNKSKEQLFLISKGDTSAMVFLTDRQKSYISAILKNKNIQPLEIRMWSKWNGII